ncbi:MAG TPA: DUF4032 domain-containing protein [Acidimicrobiales bacterium]|nr:DUF4032 domain-containing protein [Acidimicrobiales bacterium]
MTTPIQIVGRPGHPDFLDLPWELALEQWTGGRLVQVARGISRHVVRFVDYDGRIYALKETELAMAQREYRMLRALADRGLPAVEAVGVVSDRTTSTGDELPAMLITRFLDYALPYRYLIGAPTDALRNALVDAMAVLLVRLHLEGFYWGDCSLSNTLFRRDAGSLMAYLVDAETGELQPSRLTDGQREHDLSIARENIAGGLFDLAAQGRIPADTDPVAFTELGEARYHELWTELTSEDEFDAEERWRVEERIRRLNQLGFDVDELVVHRTADGARLRIQPAVVEEGHHSRRLVRLIGLEVQENQARRLLNDIDCFGAWIERETGSRPPEAVVAYRWLSEVFEPVIASIPAPLQARREPAELFHQLLEHRWFLSEAAGAEVTNDVAVRSLVEEILPRLPEERLIAGLATEELPVLRPLDDQRVPERVDGAPQGPVDDRS